MNAIKQLAENRRKEEELKGKINQPNKNKVEPSTPASELLNEPTKANDNAALGEGRKTRQSKKGGIRIEASEKKTDSFESLRVAKSTLDKLKEIKYRTGKPYWVIVKELVDQVEIDE